MITRKQNSPKLLAIAVMALLGANLAWAAAGYAADPTPPPSSAEASQKPASNMDALARILMDKGIISQEQMLQISGLAEPEKKAAPIPPAIAMLKGMNIKLNGLGQARYTYADGGTGQVEASSWKLRTARLTLTAEVMPKFISQTQLAFERASGSTSTTNSALLDASLSYAPADAFMISVGQLKVPLAAESYESPALIDFADINYAESRITNPSSNRDTGLLISGRPFDKRLFYAAGMFNGRGPNYADNNDNMFLYSLRVEGTPWKGRLLEQDASVALGAGGMWKRTASDPSLLKSDDLTGVAFRNPYDRFVYTADAAVKVGPLGVKGNYIAALLDGRRGDPRILARGFSQQAGYKFFKGKFEALARYQVYEPNDKQRPLKRAEWTTLGANYFIKECHARILANYTFRRKHSASNNNREFILQMQLSF